MLRRFPSALSKAGRAFAILVLLVAGSAAPAAAFDFNDVAERARKLADQPYKKPENKLPRELAELSYDQYRDIRFKPEAAWWRGAKLPFELQFLHPGIYADQAVHIYEIGATGTKEIRFNGADFDYGKNKIDAAKYKDLGFAGFRIHFPMNRPDYKDEVLVFPAASYFRAIGKKQRYGLSARGLAVDTGLISGEEFPRFTEFWVARPGPKDKELTVYALLDSRRVTGAFKFIVKPGSETVMDVQSRFYLRDFITKIGLAPLTSMYFFGENQRSNVDDYRPEVHDSDGLSIQSGTGEWIWRPLVNPSRLLITSFALTNPLGFGLMQRDHSFSRYEDLEARYDLRPSTWVEPMGGWGAGRVELVQIPSPDEYNDNIVAYWVPDNAPQPKKPFDLQYRLHWQMESETKPPLAYVAQTRRGRGDPRGNDNTLRFIVDFEGPALAKAKDDKDVDSVVSVGDNGELLERQSFRNEVTGGWRLSMRLRRVDDSKPVELRAYLRGPGSAVSETWSYILPPGGP